MEVDADIGCRGIHVRTFAEAFAELVNNGVLDPQRGKLAVVQGGVDQGGVHGKG